MNYFTLPLGDYQTNCYLVYDEEKNCAVIDPGYEAGTILKKTEQEGLKIKAILLTHGHFDHVGAVKELAQKTACPVWIHEQELKLPPYLTAGALYYTDLYSDVGSILNVEGLRFRILETPGHTMGSVCLLCGEVIFSGHLDCLDFDGASGDCTLKLTNCPSSIDLDGMSGDLDITLPSDCGFIVNSDGLSSDFTTDFDIKTINGSHHYGDGSCRIEVDALSGRVCIRDGGYNCHATEDHGHHGNHH